MTVFDKHPISLRFLNEAIEKEYITTSELEDRSFIRAGLILEMFAWVVYTFGFFLQDPVNAPHAAIVTLVLNFPICLFTLYILSKDSFIGKYQLFGSITLGLAGLSTNYTSNLLPYDNDYETLLILFLVMFFGFYIFRLRWFYIIIPVFINFVIFQVHVLFYNDLAFGQYINLGFPTWVIFICSAYAAHSLAMDNRRKFTQKKIIESQKEQIQQEHDRAEKLLLHILPQSIATRLKNEQSVIADHFENTSVLFADLVGFTELSQRLPANELVSLLNGIFSKFDHLTEKYQLEKIKTIGDAYMVAGGLPQPRKDHLEALADFALEMLQELANFNQDQNQNLTIRIGIHVGPAIAGVIGINKFVYDIWGDTVNIASRMETHGIPGQVHVSEATYKGLKDQFLFKDRGMVDIKGKGEMRTYFLLGKKDFV